MTRAPAPVLCGNWPGLNVSSTVFESDNEARRHRWIWALGQSRGRSGSRSRGRRRPVLYYRACPPSKTRPSSCAHGRLATSRLQVSCVSHPTTGRLLFVFSDFILAQEMFVLPEDHKLRKVTPYVIWSSYWIAQALFLISFTVVL